MFDNFANKLTSLQAKPQQQSLGQLGQLQPMQQGDHQADYRKWLLRQQQMQQQGQQPMPQILPWQQQIQQGMANEGAPPAPTSYQPWQRPMIMRRY